MGPPAPLRISVVLPAHRLDRSLTLALAAWSRADPPPHELLVVEDGTVTALAEAVVRAGGTLVRRDPATAAPRGPAAARNAGAAAATGDILYFTDADVEVPADLLSRVEALFRAEPDLTALVGSYDDAPADPGFLSQYRNLLHHFVHQQAAPDGFTFWGACGAIRRSAFAAIGGFDEAYRRPSIEDIELGYRLRDAGLRIRLEPGLQVKHLKRWSLAGMLVTDLRDRALPWSRLVLERGELEDDLNIDRRSRWSALLAGAGAAGLAVAPWRRGGLVLALAAAGGLTVLNRRFYRFLARRRGLPFAAAAAPLHWAYFLYSAGAFGAAAVQRAAGRGRPEPSR